MGYPAYNATAYPGTAGATGGDYRNLFKRAYASVIRTKAQNETSVLQGICQQETLQGDPLLIDAYKTVTLTTRAVMQQYGHQTTTLGYKPYKSTLTERRTLRPTFYEFAELFDPRHERAWMRAISPDSAYTKNVLAAFARRKDLTIITAFDASVTLQGEHVTGTQAITTGASGNTVWYRDPRLIAGANTGGRMDLERVLIASRLLNNTGHRGKRYAVISPVGLEQILADPNITSADYNAVKLLMSGEIKSFMGFEWIWSPDIPSSTVKFDAGSSTTTTGYASYFLTENAMAFGMTSDVRVRFAEIPDRGFALQAFHEFGVGAVRLDENAIIRVQHVD